MTALPKQVEQLIPLAVSKAIDDYVQIAFLLAAGEAAEEEIERAREKLSRTLVLADMLGRRAFHGLLQTAPVERRFIASDRGILEAALAGSQFAAAPAGIARILSMGLGRMALHFIDRVPLVVEKIRQVAEAKRSFTQRLWAEESVRILHTLVPILTDRIQRGGLSLEEFFESAEARLARTEFADLARSRLENIYRTNVSTASNAAAWEEAHEPELLAQTPFYRYVAVDDGRVRPHHWAFDGLVAPATWPGWQLVWPPNGYQCRCSPPIPVFHAEARRKGLVDERGIPQRERYVSTWNKAIAAGLLRPDGLLTYPRSVPMIDRTGKTIRDSFPQAGFDISPARQLQGAA